MSYIYFFANFLMVQFIFVKRELVILHFSHHSSFYRQNFQIFKFSSIKPKLELPTYLQSCSLMHILYENISWQLVTENAIKQILLHIFRFWPTVYQLSSSLTGTSTNILDMEKLLKLGAADDCLL